jgi:hypothetical protein
MVNLNNDEYNSTYLNDPKLKRSPDVNWICFGIVLLLLLFCCWNGNHLLLSQHRIIFLHFQGYKSLNMDPIYFFLPSACPV